jgi:membrane-associated phospholipid phosphatase
MSSRPGAGSSSRELVTTQHACRRPMVGGRTDAACQPAHPSHGAGLARAATELLAPANLAVAQLLLVGWHSSPGPAGLGWGLLAATFCGLLPYGIVIAGVRRKRWGDRHLRDRRQRPGPLLAGLASVVAGLAILVALGAPRELVALVVAMLAGLAAALVVTLWWKLSLHTAGVAGTVAILALAFGPALILALPAVTLVAWSRVRLGDHTPAQTVAGAALGGLVATTVFVLLR